MNATKNNPVDSHLNSHEFFFNSGVQDARLVNEGSVPAKSAEWLAKHFSKSWVAGYLSAIKGGV